MTFIELLRSAGALGGIGLVLVLSAQLKSCLRQNLKAGKPRNI